MRSLVGIGEAGYATVAPSMIADLFAAGIVPALLMTIVVMFTGWAIARRRGYATEAFPGFYDVLRRLVAALPGLLLVAMIFLGIRAGIFTAVESAAIAVFYAIAVTGLVYRRLTWEHFVATCTGAVRTTGLILFVIGAAAPMPIVQRFSWFPRVALAGYAAMTIAGYLVMGPYFTLGWIAKGIEVVLITLIAVDVVRVYGSPMGLVRSALESVAPFLPARFRTTAA